MYFGRGYDRYSTLYPIIDNEIDACDIADGSEHDPNINLIKVHIHKLIGHFRATQCGQIHLRF